MSAMLRLSVALSVALFPCLSCLLSLIYFLQRGKLRLNCPSNALLLIVIVLCP